MNFSIELCSDRLWNSTLTWNTDTPKLTKCLSQVGFSIIPNLFILILILFDFGLTIRSKNNRIRFNSYNVTRSLLTLFGIVSSLILLFNYINYNQIKLNLSDLVLSIIQLLVFILLLIVFYYHTVHGVITSCLTFTITFILSLCYGIRFLDLTLYNGSMYYDYEKQNIKRIFLCCFCLFGFSFFPDDTGSRKSRSENDVDQISEHNLTTEDHEAPESPREYSSFISKITLFWYTKLIKLSYGRVMNLNEIYKVPKSLEVNLVCEEFNLNYHKEVNHIKKINQSSNKKRKFNTLSLIKIMWTIFRKRIMLIAFLRIFGDFLQFTSPLLLNLMINLISDPNEQRWHLIIIIFGFALASSFKFILVNYTDMQSFIIGINIRTALSNLVFNKTLKLSPQAKRKQTTGVIINLFNVDSGKFTGTAPFFVLFLSSPLQIFFGFYLLYMFLGNAALIGIIVIAFSMLSQYILTRFNYKYFATELNINDERMKLVNEMLSGIKLIKVYSWEDAFKERINNVRNKQSKYFKRVFCLEAVLGWIFFSLTPVLIFTATITIYVLFVDNNLTPSKVFSAIAVFNLLDVPIEGLPYLISYIITSKISLKRLSSFLGEDELENYVSRNFNSKFAIEIKNKATFAWELEDNQDNDNQAFSESTERLNDESKNEEKKRFELKDIQLEIKRGEFIAIIGQVGNGKSSLISAILGEMYLIENDSGLKGKLNISEEQNICYVSQIPWIQNNSFKNNILFNKSFDKQKYDDVIRSCALEPDLKQFEDGDETEIGEKGINLSGGQKQRVSIARACYSSLFEDNQNQIILLDDPLSAVDTHVGKHLCKNVLNSKTGLLKNTTRILVTNQLNQLNDLNVDQIILLRNGRIELKCTYNELNNLNREGKLNSFNLKLTQNEEIYEKTNEDDNESITSNDSKENNLKEIKKEKNKLIEIEKREVGRVKLRNYLIYLKYYGIFNMIIVLLIKIGESFFQLYSRVYLKNWTENNLNKSHIDKETNIQHLIIFAEYSLAECLLNLFANLIMTIGMIRTIKLFHQKLLHKVLRSRISFFDTTPLGRIINRFSSDISSIDLVLPFAVRSFIIFLTKLLSSIVILIIEQPDTFIFYIIILILYIYIMNLYISSTRSLKRLDSISKSPVLSIFSDTLSGQSTIKAFGRVNQFENNLKSKMDINNRTYWYFQYGIRWLKFNLNMITNLILFIITFQFLVDKENITAGNVGLLLSYCLSLTDSLGFVIRHMASIEENGVSIERINEYSNNEEEAELIEENNRPPLDWPQNGEIKFIDYSTRYRENTNLVLKDLNFNVDKMEKIGVVGRTGAGKSTITLALFRMIEPVEGKIIIDNIDISKIGLHDLRSKLSIIPQDPVLFTGTIRFNLDPFDKYSDKEIYESLEHAHLKEYINQLEDGIEHEIAEGGENLSVGQRQLICLARALLRKSKILVLDEATASVDFATDELVQKTIRSEFKDCTIITIAHRLNTVLDSNRILVLDKGELKEYDKPDILLDNTNSLFYKMALKSSIVDRNQF